MFTENAIVDSPSQALPLYIVLFKPSAVSKTLKTNLKARANREKRIKQILNKTYSLRTV